MKENVNSFRLTHKIERSTVLLNDGEVQLTEPVHESNVRLHESKNRFYSKDWTLNEILLEKDTYTTRMCALIFVELVQRRKFLKKLLQERYIFEIFTAKVLNFWKIIVNAPCHGMRIKAESLSAPKSKLSKPKNFLHPWVESHKSDDIFRI